MAEIPQALRYGAHLAAIAGASLVAGMATEVPVAQAHGLLTEVYPAVVTDTCNTGNCGLNERLEPTTLSGEVGRLYDGDVVDVTCVERGTFYNFPIAGDPDYSTYLWAKYFDPKDPRYYDYSTTLFLRELGTKVMGPSSFKDVPKCKPYNYTFPKNTPPNTSRVQNPPKLTFPKYFSQGPPEGIRFPIKRLVG